MVITNGATVTTGTAVTVNCIPSTFVNSSTDGEFVAVVDNGVTMPVNSDFSSYRPSQKL